VPARHADDAGPDYSTGYIVRARSPDHSKECFMNKKRLFFAALLSIGLAAGALAADCSMTGTWVFDMKGMSATVEYKADGTLSQDMFGMQVTGTYTVKGNKLTTVVGDTTTVFTILSCSPTAITIKRDKDGMTVVYKKK
jgi:hypothetical protein